MKKLASLLLALVMVLSMAMNVSATDVESGPYSITLENQGDAILTGHTYSVYQIFTGKLYKPSEEETAVLSDVKYGKNYGTEGNVVPETELDAIKDARAFADDLVKNNKLIKPAIATLKDGNWKATGLVAGYYLVVDETEVLPEGHTKSAYIVQVVDDVTMKPKQGSTTFDKVITDDDYLNDTSNIVSGKYDNVSVGSVVNYTLTSTIPSNADDYDFFYFIMNDKLSEGLTFNNDITVTIGGETATEGTDYKVHKDNAKYTFQVALLKANENAGKAVVVTYTATLNEKAKIGEIEGNPNTANLEFSNNPDFDHNGTDDDEDGRPDKDTNVPMGVTPDKVTRTYTTGLKLLKVDENGDVLKGAKFELTGDTVKKVLVSEVTFVENTEGTYYKLKNDTYTTEAPRTVAEYVEKTGDRDSGYVKVGENEYKEATEDQLADVNTQLYKLLEANADSYVSTTVKYERKVTHSLQDKTQAVKIEAEVAADGSLEFVGLGEGTYTIKETVVPDGYNEIDDITVTITWVPPVAPSDDCNWTVKVDGVEIETANGQGLYEFEVENRSGATLPETGGMGTTIFYVVGTILVLGAAVLMVTKKRMSSAK